MESDFVDQDVNQKTCISGVENKLVFVTFGFSGSLKLVWVALGFGSLNSVWLAVLFSPL